MASRINAFRRKVALGHSELTGHAKAEMEQVQQRQSWRFFLHRFMFLASFLVLGYVSGAEESPAEQTLAVKGLQKKGSFYVLASEVELSQRLQTIAGIEEKLAKNLRALRDFEMTAKEREQDIRDYELELRSLNEQLSQIGQDQVVENNRLVGRIGDLSLRIKLLDEQNSADAGPLLSGAAESRHEFLDTVATLAGR